MLSNYEQERLARIKHNESFLQQLDIKFNTVVPPKERKLKRKTVEPRAQEQGEARRSRRLEGKDKPLYTAPPKPKRKYATPRVYRRRRVKEEADYYSEESDDSDNDPYAFKDRQSESRPVRKSSRVQTRAPVYNFKNSEKLSISSSDSSSSSNASPSSPSTTTKRRTADHYLGRCVVMFTGVSEHKKRKLREAVEDLGGDVEEKDITLVTHVVASRFAITAKMLGAFCCSPPPRIVAKKWLAASENAGKFVDASRYVIKDPEAEKRYNFSIKTSLEHAKQRTKKLFQGVQFYITAGAYENFLPNLIKAAGGVVMHSLPTPYVLEKNRNKFFMICPKAQAEEHAKVTKIDLKFFRDEEFVISAILQQQIQAEEEPDEESEEDEKEEEEEEEKEEEAEEQAEEEQEEEEEEKGGEEDGYESEVLNEEAGGDEDALGLMECYVYV